MKCNQSMTTDIHTLVVVSGLQCGREWMYGCMCACEHRALPSGSVLVCLGLSLSLEVCVSGSVCLPCPALPCPALPCPALPCPALPCPALPCPALPRAVLHHISVCIAVCLSAFTKRCFVPNGAQEKTRFVRITFLSRPCALRPRGLWRRCTSPALRSGAFTTPEVVALRPCRPPC